METLNDAYFFLTDKLFALQGFFRDEAYRIARIVLLISICLAALNYAMTGQGFKESIIKIGKACVFFFIIMNMYPWIISKITDYTFNLAKDSTYNEVYAIVMKQRQDMADDAVNRQRDYEESLTRNALRAQYTADSWILTDGELQEKYKDVDLDSIFDDHGNLENADYILQEEYRKSQNSKNNSTNPADILDAFEKIIKTRQIGDFTYSAVAPAACFQILMITAQTCIDFAEENSKRIPNFPKIGIGFICAAAVIATGVFAVIEYLLAFMEFLFVTSVGIILFPFSLWEGSKFLAEKLIGAVTGFFVKLLFCNICIFLLLWGYMTLASDITTAGFKGSVDEIVKVVFISFLFFILCKNAPGLAQSLLTGTPSLNAAGAISAVGSMAAGAMGAAKMMGSTGQNLLSGGAKSAFAGAGALAQAAGASSAVGAAGGGRGAQTAAFLKSIGGSAMTGMKAAGGDMVRSLLAPGSSPGHNRNSQLQTHLNTVDKNTGNRQTLGENLAGRFNAGNLSRSPNQGAAGRSGIAKAAADFKKLQKGK